MAQDRESGAAGNRYGHEFGEKLAKLLGAQILSKGSNECLLDGERIVIKCRHKGRVQKVGVTHLMLERLVAVVGAFEEPDGSYTITRLPVKRFRAAMTPTRIKGPSADRVSEVRRAVFDRHGTVVCTLRI
jgi:hypothetical protein